ncbi:MAG: hypothetical protein JW702_02940 [Clostridiales bacterium]|nr:hypothetical protein [Clostridiales bacterium]
MKKKLSMMLALVLVISSLLPSVAFAVPYKNINLNMEEYTLHFSNGRIFGELPYGLAKRGEGNLPPGLAKKIVLPPGLDMFFKSDDYTLYVNKMIIKYNIDDTKAIISEIEDLLDSDILDEDAINDLLDELKDTYLWSQYVLKVENIIAQCDEVDSDLVVDIEALLDNPENKDAIEELVKELQELCDCQVYIADVYGILDEYDADEDVRESIEALLEERPIDKEAVQEIIDALIEEYEKYESLVDQYDELLADINEIIESEDFVWMDEDTGISFMTTFNIWNALEISDQEEFLEAIAALQLLYDYLDNMYTIDTGIEELDAYKAEIVAIINDEGFESGEGFALYFTLVEDTFNDYIDQIEDLENPELFDIIVLIKSIEEFMLSYEEMRYITTDEFSDYIAKRDEGLALVYDDDDFDALYEDFESLSDELDDEDYITYNQYQQYLILYDDLMELYEELTE